ncbi:Proteoglycan 4 [Takifugu flavidus]|uniref:Proteoglycan 4 n=1 Tax=Takifugu flavidus TaxID=433684 RepID=A0A5C6MXK3_9TELE|nr:Proteoglycan 4 [Takifugu flavidus]
MCASAHSAEIQQKMSSTVTFALVFLACALTLSTGQTSCKGRCGGEYYRGYTCQCDYTCLTYDECCDDYESQCTTKNSCKGRCGEAFRRGRGCSCDPDCQKFKQCCSDFQTHCDAADAALKDGAQPSPTFSGGSDADDPSMPPVSPAADSDDLSDEPDDLPQDGFGRDGSGDPEPTPDPGSIRGDGLPAGLDQSTDSTPDSNSAEFSRETSTVFPPATSGDGATPAAGVLTPLSPTEAETVLPDALGSTPASSDGPRLTQTPPSPAGASASTGPKVGLTTALENFEASSSAASSPPAPTAATSKDVTTALRELLTTLIPASSDAVRGVTRDDTTAVTTNDPSAVTQQPAKTTSKPLAKPSPAKPTSVTQSANGDGLSSYQADDSNDTDLCSGRPVSGVTTLRNGTMVVFRGHYFWVLDKNKLPGAAQSITQTWGVPSPIDTVFTRCNCEGKTYIFKGNQYWRFENGVVDTGYPKPVQSGFDGLQGHITAALSVPQYRKRRESVYFFKRGGLVQKYSYHFTPSTTCGTKPKINIYAVRHRVSRQAAASNLGPAINIRASWSGFPSTITAAVSVPNKRDPEGYKYYVFSRGEYPAQFYKVGMKSERPALAAPATNTFAQNNFFKCPQKV